MLIKNLTFKFNVNNPDYFYHDLTVDFPPNEVHFIQGDNGAGKSTLFNIIQGRINVRSLCTGTIVISGIEYVARNNKFPDAFTQQVHTVRQQYDQMIADQFTFAQNLQFANLSTHPGFTRLPKATFFEVTELFNIDTHKPVHMLSGGQRQLLAILMALQKPTQVLLLDEPTATLDKNNAHLTIECLNTLAKELNITILIICHDAAIIKKYGNGNCYRLSIDEDDKRTITKD